MNNRLPFEGIGVVILVMLILACLFTVIFSGCGEHERPVSSVSSVIMTDRLEIVSNTLVCNRLDDIRIVRDKQTGQEFVWASGNKSCYLMPIHNSNLYNLEEMNNE